LHFAACIEKNAGMRRAMGVVALKVRRHGEGE
jgi:hypothetical protein